jgi:hypothetical protein
MNNQTYPIDFLKLLESKLSPENKLREALDLFEAGILSYSDIFTLEELNLTEIQNRKNLKTEDQIKYDAFMDKHDELWNNSIQVKGRVSKSPRGDWYQFVLLDKQTKEIMAIGDEQGNYAGGLYYSCLNGDWNAEKAMNFVKEKDVQLYNSILAAQNHNESKKNNETNA